MDILRITWIYFIEEIPRLSPKCEVIVDGFVVLLCETAVRPGLKSLRHQVEFEPAVLPGDTKTTLGLALHETETELCGESTIVHKNVRTVFDVDIVSAANAD